MIAIKKTPVRVSCGPQSGLEVFHFPAHLFPLAKKLQGPIKTKTSRLESERLF